MKKSTFIDLVWHVKTEARFICKVSTEKLLGQNLNKTVKN